MQNLFVTGFMWYYLNLVKIFKQICSFCEKCSFLKPLIPDNCNEYVTILLFLWKQFSIYRTILKIPKLILLCWSMDIWRAYVQSLQYYDMEGNLISLYKDVLNRLSRIVATPKFWRSKKPL